MSEHLSTLDTETDMLEAFSSFDEDDRGFVKGTEMRDALKGSGDRMTDDEVRMSPNLPGHCKCRRFGG